LDAIVMAAGEGSRLRPLTERWAKPILPIDGRAVIAMLLRELVAAGIRRATVVTGHLAEQVESLVGDGSGYGLEVGFARQPRADGSADAVNRALAAGAGLPALVTAADTLYTAGDVGRFRAAFEASARAGALAVRRDPPPGAGRRPVRIRADLVERVVDDDPANPLGGAPLWALGPDLEPFLAGLPGPPYELAEAFQRAVDSGFRVAGVEIGRTRDLTDPFDLVEENFPYSKAL
jgi:UDP-N-acetylglucosamine diphosphorylase / glucose-1-phosphate thymidylyltransferase / UDP-N-acetylgalactosamine diphosphorylase / glucosamine-1-phosphate N-acetyltransferase / galactosamine-1-phosphate N-acetyltransferase